MKGRRGVTDRFLTTVLLTDIVGSTEHAAELGDSRWRDLVQSHHSLVRAALRRHGGRELDTAGDGFFAVFDAPAAAVDCALDLFVKIREIGLELRAGVHVGEVEQIGRKVGGISVPIAARIMSIAAPGEVLVSQTVRDLAAGSGLRFDDRGTHPLRGVPGEWHLYVVSRTGERDGEATDITAGAARRAAAVRTARSRSIWRRYPRTSAAVATVLAGVVGVAGLLVFKPWQAPALASIPEDSVGVIDADRAEIVGSVKVSGRPAGIAVLDGQVWVANTATNTVSRIDLETRTVTREVDVGRSPSGIAASDGSIWVANSGERTVSRINAGTARVVDTIPVGNVPTAVVAGAGSVWVANGGDSTIMRIDPASGTPGDPIPVAAGPVALAIDETGLWVASADGASITHLDAARGVTLTAPISLAARPSGIAINNGALWVAAVDGTVTRIDTATSRVTATVDVGGSLSAIAVADGVVWAGDRQGYVHQIDAANPSTTPRRTPTTSSPEALTVINGDLWVATHASPDSHRGGTLTAVFVGYDALDPTSLVPYNSAAFLQADGLVGWRRVGGGAGASLLPNLATSIPQPSNGGRTYTFELRRDLVYSDGQPVRPADFRRAIERSFQVAAGPFGAIGTFMFGSIVGAEACSLPENAPVERCDLSAGIVADDSANTVTIELARPDADLLYKLALPAAYPAAESMPMNARVTAGFPGTGPYVVAEANSTRIRFTRNPNFRVWNAQVRPDGFADEIVFNIVTPDTLPEERVAMVERGEADYIPLRGPNRIPPELTERIQAQYAAQLHFGPALLTAVLMNAQQPPFDRIEVRQAVNMAVDRALVAGAFGQPASNVTCQMLPPGWPGYQPYCPYTAQPDPGGRWKAPDLEAANVLIDASGTRGADVVVGPVVGFRIPARDHLVDVLEELGYNVTIDPETDQELVLDALLEGRIQIGVFDFVADFLAPSGYFQGFSCADSETSGYPCDPDFDALTTRALELQMTDAAAAAAAWAEVDRSLVDRAVLAPLFNPGGDFVSARVGNFQFHPAYFVLLDQLWVQ